MAEVDLGSFRLATPFARGAMGEVWRAWHRDQRLPVALKVVTGAHARSERYLRYFQNEVRAVASLDHPWIVTVLDVGIVDAAAASDGRLREGSPWLAMEYASDGTLAERWPTTWVEVRHLLLCLLDALGHAHARGVTHRDLKPANVLLCGDRDPRPGPKLTDFGIAARFGAEDPADPGAGTPAYMAPEQLLGEVHEIGPWSDLYGLGCLAWRATAGKLPFEGLRRMALVRAHLAKELPSWESVMAVPRGFHGWLAALLAKRPEDRPQRAADAAAALVALEDGKVDDPVAEVWCKAIAADEEDTLLPGDLETAEADTGERARARAIGPAPLPPDWREPASVRPPVLVGAGLGLFGLREPPLVGRQLEQDYLWDELRAVHVHGRSRLVAITGPSGTGKTRLASWLCRRADELGAARVLWVEPRAGDDGGLVPTLARMLRCEGMDADARERHLPTVVGDKELAATVSALLGRELDAEARRRVSARLVASFASERPVILCLDELAAADLEVVSTLLSAGGWVLVVLVVQDEALAGRPREAELLEALPGLRLALGPLDAPARRALVQGLLALEDDLASQVEARSGGNPLFAVQLVGDWVARGWLQAGERGFALRDDARRRGVLAFPDDLHQVWARAVDGALDGLPAVAAWDLEVAAALGPEVDERTWGLACEGDRWARGQLVDRLLRARLAVPREDGWAFAHEMLRATVVRLSRERGRWARVCRACADALGRVTTGRADPGRVGSLLLEAGDPGAAVALLLAGVDEARRTSVRRALALLVLAEEAARAGGLDPGDPANGRILVSRARVQAALGEPDEALRASRRAREAAAVHGWEATRRSALEVELGVHLSRRDVDAARATFEVLAPMVRAAGDARSLGDLLNAEAGLLQGDPAAVDRADGLLVEAIAAYEAAGARPESVAMAEMNRAFLAKDAGRLDVARARLEAALERLGTRGPRHHVGMALAMLAEVHLRLGDVRRAEQVARRGVAVLDTLGHSASEARLVLGSALTESGQHEAALQALLQVLRSSVEVGRTELVAPAAVAVALVEARLARWAAVHDRLRDAERAVRETPLDPHGRELARRLADLARAANFPQLAARAGALGHGA